MNKELCQLHLLPAVGQSEFSRLVVYYSTSFRACTIPNHPYNIGNIQLSQFPLLPLLLTNTDKAQHNLLDCCCYRPREDEAQRRRQDEESEAPSPLIGLDGPVGLLECMCMVASTSCILSGTLPQHPEKPILSTA